MELVKLAKDGRILVTVSRWHLGPFYGRTLRRVLTVSLVDGLAAVVAAAERV